MSRLWALVATASAVDQGITNFLSVLRLIIHDKVVHRLSFYLATKLSGDIIFNVSSGNNNSDDNRNVYLQICNMHACQNIWH